MIGDVWAYPIWNAASDAPVTVGDASVALFVVLVGLFAIRLVRRALGRRLAKTQWQPDAIQLLQRIVFFALLAGLFMLALALLDVPLTAFAFVSGAVAIGVGFGAQNIINNFISGWILMSERPVRIGDFIEIDEAKGVVEEIGNRSTRVRRVDGVHMLVPNSQMLERTVVNWTLVDRTTRTTLRVGVAYGSPLRRVKELIDQAVDEQTETIADPPPVVVLEDFGDNAIVFDAFFWCEVSGEKELRVVRSDIRFRIAELFEANGIVIAFPQRDVHLDAAAPIPVKMVPE